VSDVVVLSYSECEALLRSGVAGRVAVTGPAGPHIIPVNYSVVGPSIVLRTSPKSVLGTHGGDAILAFEVDQFDYEYHQGWSVVARGRGHVIEDEGEMVQVERVWPPRPWAGGDRPLFLRLAWTELTGRRVGRGYNPLAGLPVRRVV